MQKHLYFICPTDHLETVITRTFKRDHYFISSLANSIELDQESVEYINGLIETEKINEISFILSKDNQMINCAIQNPNRSNSYSMYNSKSTIDLKIKNLACSKKTTDVQLIAISNYLDKKISELQLVINKWIVQDIQIKALIYNQNNNTFVEAIPALFKINQFGLN